MTWHRLTTGSALTEREVDRTVAKRIPFLLDFAVTDVDWPDRRSWDLKSVADLSPGLGGTALLDLALRSGQMQQNAEAAEMTAFMQQMSSVFKTASLVFDVTDHGLAYWTMADLK